MALYLLLGHKIHYLVLFVIAYILSITNAYIGYKTFVFKTNGNYLKEYFRFYLVYGVVFVLNIILLPIMVECFYLSPLIAPWALIFINVAISYFGHKRFSFR